MIKVCKTHFYAKQSVSYLTFMRFYCCLWRFSTPVVAPIRDPIVSAESDIYKLKNTRAEKPISFTSRFFCSQVDVRGLRCDVTRKPFHLTLSKGKQSYLSTGKDFTLSNPPTLADQGNWIEFLSELSESSKMGLRFSSYRNLSQPRRFRNQLTCHLKKTKCLHFLKICRVRKNSKSLPSGSSYQIEHVFAICTSVVMTRSIL